jgi:sigma-B regulation protein RsbU (phosphoserine phosphatase)
MARPLVAVVLAAFTLLYTLLWINAMRRVPDVELGFEETYLAQQHAVLVNGVKKDSPAEQAGLMRDDHIVGVDGKPIRDADTLYIAYYQRKAGDSIQLTIERQGEAKPVVLTGIFRTRRSGSLADDWAALVQDSFPVPFVVVGLTVMFLRLEDPTVWLLALLFVSFAATPGFPDDFLAVPATLRPFCIAWRGVFLGLLGPLFYIFLARFPTQSAIDRRRPWLKWVALVLALLVAVDTRPEPPLAKLVGPDADGKIVLGCIFPFLSLGLIVLAHTYFRTAAPDARRRIRVFFWGTLVGVTPALLVAEAKQYAGFSPPGWITTTINLVLFLFPLSFAYAVVKHRVLEIPVLLKRSARYLLVQRGFIFLLSLGSIGVTLLFAMSFSRFLQPVIDVAESSTIALGAVFGTVLLWGGSQVHRSVSGKIDRAFFRAAYDARRILEDLAERTRTATDSRELARTLEHSVREALQPSSLAIYLQSGDGRLTAASEGVPPELATLPEIMPELQGLAARGRPSDGPAPGLAALRPDCLVPIPGRGGRLAGLIVLGARQSEEPYSGEDKRLLASVASQAGTALENIRLAQEIAERMEHERRAAREMEIAKEVQSRLLPQTPPRLKTIECGAHCIQARSVGGDYYDFLDLGADRVGLVLADVSGKGVHAALLVANLQAYLRSQCGMGPLDPVQVLQRVNQMLWKSTAAQHYATLFFGIYDDGARQLSYVNCGHNPPIWLRRDGTVERLEATATVIGLFEKWEGALGQVQLAPGDLLAIFSDGVTEETCDGEDFGDARLIDELQARREGPVSDMISGVLGSVLRFGAGKQSDDLTLLIASVNTGSPRT